MTGALTELLSLLELEDLGGDRHRGPRSSDPGPSVYGGHVAAQAMMAAGRTVPGWGAHSLHAYFLRPGDPAEPIVYAVDRLRDGKSFATRHVTASQGGAPIFTLSASFHASEPGLEHQKEMPSTPPPGQYPRRLGGAGGHGSRGGSGAEEVSRGGGACASPAPGG